MPQYTIRSKSSQDASGAGARALVALGANIPSRFGSPVETLQAALRRMGTVPLHVENASRLFSTRAFRQTQVPTT